MNEQHPMIGSVKCRLCGDPTWMLATKLCDSCYELERRVHANPEIARRIGFLGFLIAVALLCGVAIAAVIVFSK